MSSDNDKIRNEIPESLKRQLEEFRKLLWRRKVIESVAAGLIGLLVSYLFIFGLDRLVQTPGWARLLILLGGISLFVGFAPYWLHRWVWGHRREGQLAKLIAKRFPGLGDRLLGIIELQEQNEDGDTLSPRLRAAAMEVVAAEAGRRKLDSALPAERHRKWAAAAILLMMIVGVAFSLAPKAGINALERWLKPFSEVERYTFTQLRDPIRTLAVPFGEAFSVTLALSENSEQKPENALGRYELQPQVVSKLKGDSYTFEFPGQQEKGTIVFKIGDVRHEILVEPMQRPSVTDVRVVVKSPAYMEIPEREIALSIGEVSAVEGSELTFLLDTSRPLTGGSFGPTEVSGEMAQDESFESTSGELSLSGRTATVGPIMAGTVPFSLPFKWVDEFGLEGGEDFKLRVDAVADAPPAAYTQGLDRQNAILPEEVLDFEILCEDDFGLKQVGIEWQSLGSTPGEDPVENGEIIVSRGGPEERRLMESVAFSPAAFSIGPQRLMLRSFAEDYYPERGRVYSEPVMVYVLSREEHAQLLKSQFDRTLGELEDLARKELNLLDENQRLERLDPDELQNDDNKERIEAQEKSEGENVEKMKELTQRMEQLMKDAARNGDIDKETMKDMAEATKSMQELSEKDMPEVQEQLKEAGEPSNTAEKSKENVEKAVEEQKEVIEKIKKAIEQANKANKRFEASTFVARLKKAAGEQTGIVAILISKFINTDILGERENEVDPADQRDLTEATKQQVVTAADVRWIQEDLGHYHARTGDEAFKKVLDLMQTAKIDVELETVRSKLQKNHSYEAAETSKSAADKLAEWAKILGDDMDKEGGGGGGGGGGGSPEDEDFEFMLRVMKMIQTQQDLRGRTRVLEQLKRDASAPVAPER
ncbi:MAG: hypothetical protein AB8D78_11845 [Akkermansiaceae bacterium]